MTLSAFLEYVVAERVRTPYEPGHRSIRSEASRLAFLHNVERASDQLAILSDVVRTHPDGDEMADLVINRLRLELDRAGVELNAFRNLRECAGRGSSAPLWKPRCAGLCRERFCRSGSLEARATAV